MVFQNFPNSAWKLWSSSANGKIPTRKIKIILLHICLTSDGLCTANVYSAHWISHVISVESSNNPMKEVFSPFHRGFYFYRELSAKPRFLVFLELLHRYLIQASGSWRQQVMWACHEEAGFREPTFPESHNQRKKKEVEMWVELLSLQSVLSPQISCILYMR